MRAKLLLIAAAAGISGCQTEDTMRLDGMTIGAGNAIAANSVMQMVDPWPQGVENPHLMVPAVRKTSAEAPPASSETKP